MTADFEHWLDGSPPPEVARLLRAARRSCAPSYAVDRTAEAARVASVSAGAIAISLLAGYGSSLRKVMLRAGTLSVAGGVIVATGVLLRLSLQNSPQQRGEHQLAAFVRSGRAKVDTHVASLLARKKGEVGAADAVALVEPASGIDEKLAVESFRPPVYAPSPSLHGAVAKPQFQRYAEADGPSISDEESPPSELAQRDSMTDGLKRQKQLLHRARLSLESGNPRRTLRQLQLYERSFAPRYFIPEVLYLRFQAMRTAGDSAAALRVGLRLVKQFPRTKQALSVKRLMNKYPGR